jgi:DNA polymerase III alpha subunit
MFLSAEILPPKFRRTIPNDIRYKERLAIEFSLIDKNNFTEVFLQVQIILSFMDDIPHIIRGSAGSSLVCWLLGISFFDPIEYGLELARFMNDGRTDMPDIDIDVPYNRRDELYARIARAFPGRVARISNHVKFQPKSAMREALRQVGVKGMIPKHYKLGKLLAESKVSNSIDDVKLIAKNLEGTERLTSLHCGGIVIFDNSVPKDLILKEHLELESDSGASLCQIKLDKDETEDAGHIKIDLLSNRGLAQAIGVCESLKLDLWHEIPKSWIGQIRACFTAGDTIGLTFGESRGMRRIFKDIRPQGINEIAIALALIRPAAAEGGRKKRYIDNYNNDTLPSLDVDIPIVYDDDAIRRICAVLSCSSATGDRWRKAFAKKNTTKISDFEMQLALRGISGIKKKSLLGDLHQLAKYSFCKSHALSYAFLVWRLAYLKVRWPHEFWISTLNHNHSDYKRWVHMREARCSGLLLSRGKAPYKLGLRCGLPAIVPCSGGEQMILGSDDSLAQIEKDMYNLGYWCSEKFFPGCELNLYREEGDEHISATFSGIVATGRMTHGLTLLCIGVDNGRYIDLVVDNCDPSLFIGGVEGTGIYKNTNSETITVEDIRPISYSSMIMKTRILTEKKTVL